MVGREGKQLRLYLGALRAAAVAFCHEESQAAWDKRAACPTVFILKYR